jgi:hypothetical protein
MVIDEDESSRTERLLFLSGNQRSGKTLVQLMLSSHPEVSISPGSQIVQKLFYTFPRHRLLLPPELDQIRRLLAKDRKLSAWRVDHDALEQRVAAYHDVTSREVLLDLMRFFRDQTKPSASMIGNKKGFYCKGADIVREVLPEAKFVFMMRDGRGAVASMLDNQPEHDPVSASLMWRLKSQRIRTFARRYPASCFVVRYEELVTNPEAMCRRLCHFLGLAFSRAMLLDYRDNDAVRHTTDLSHPATYREITTAFIDRWRDRFDRPQLELVESLIGAELEAQGYRPELWPRLPALKRARGAALGFRDHLDWLGTHLTRKYLVY